MRSLKYRTWLLIVTQHTIREVSDMLGVSYQSAADAVRALVDNGQAVPTHSTKGGRGRKGVYIATDKAPRPEGRGREKGSAAGLKLGPKRKPKVKRLATPGQRRSDKPIVNGYGQGRCALEEVWR